MTVEMAACLAYAGAGVVVPSARRLALATRSGIPSSREEIAEATASC